MFANHKQALDMNFEMVVIHWLQYKSINISYFGTIYVFGPDSQLLEHPTGTLWPLAGWEITSWRRIWDKLDDQRNMPTHFCESTSAVSLVDKKFWVDLTGGIKPVLLLSVNKYEQQVLNCAGMTMTLTDTVTETVVCADSGWNCSMSPLCWASEASCGLTQWLSNVLHYYYSRQRATVFSLSYWMAVRIISGNEIKAYC